MVLLIAMVLSSAGLVFIVGSSAIDAFESGANREKVQMCVDESDHRLSTVAMTGKDQPMSFEDPNCQPEVAANGAIALTWYNDSTGTPDWNDSSRTVSQELGSLEFELEDPAGRTVDTETVTLPSTLGTTEEETIELVWQTDSADNGTVEISARSEDTEDSALATIEEAEHGPGASHGPGVGPAPGDGSVDGGGDRDVGPGESDSSGDDLPGTDSDITVNVDAVEVN
jgi:hypothetical protein